MGDLIEDDDDDDEDDDYDEEEDENCRSLAELAEIA